MTARANCLRRTLRALWRSRTHYAGIALGLIIAAQPALMDWLRYRLDAADYALGGLIVTVVISVMRAITTKPVTEK